MRKLHRLLRISVLSLMVLTSLSVGSNTYAYFASGISGDNEIDTVLVTVGTWTQIFEWDSNTTYSTGDIVEWQGRFYQARRNTTGVQPRGPWFWFFFWTEITL